MQIDDDDRTEGEGARGGSEGGGATPSTWADEVRARAEARKERTALALRENLLRRKQQGRARRAGAADDTDGLPAAKMHESKD